MSHYTSKGLTRWGSRSSFNFFSSLNFLVGQKEHAWYKSHVALNFFFLIKSICLTVHSTNRHLFATKVPNLSFNKLAFGRCYNHIWLKKDFHDNGIYHNQSNNLFNVTSSCPRQGDILFRITVAPWQWTICVIVL